MRNNLWNIFENKGSIWTQSQNHRNSCRKVWNTFRTRGTNTEHAKLDETLNTIIPREVENEREELDCDLQALRQIIYEENEALEPKTIQEGIGRVFTTETKADQSTAEGKGLTEAIVGIQANLVLTTRNAEGKKYHQNRDWVTVEIESQQGHDRATEVRVQNIKDGSN